MPKSTLIFGSIGAVVESSDIQRRAYNRAFREAGLGWEWDEETYAELLTQSGGKERLSMLAAATDHKLSATLLETIHARKTQIACDEIVASHVDLRPGVVDLIKIAKARHMKVAFVTTTYRPNIDAILTSAGPALAASDFDYIGSRDNVEKGKPAPDAYITALKSLDVGPSDVLAVEDTANSVMSAKRAGIDVVATPGRLTADQDFWQADLVVANLSDANGVDQRVISMLG